MIEAVYDYYPDGTVKRERQFSNGKVIMDTEYYEDGKVKHLREWSNDCIIIDVAFDKDGDELVKVTYDCNGVINTLLDRRNPEEPVLFYFYESGSLASRTSLYQDGGIKNFTYYLDDTTVLIARNYNCKGKLTDAYDKYLEED